MNRLRIVSKGTAYDTTLHIDGKPVQTLVRSIVVTIEDGCNVTAQVTFENVELDLDAYVDDDVVQLSGINK